MEDLSESNARFEQNLELAYSSELQARFDQVQFSNDLPYQPDFYAPLSPSFHHPLPPHCYPINQPDFHPSSSFQNAYNPHSNNQFHFPENDQIFFQNPNSVPNFQFPAYEDNYPYIQNQQSIFHPQPHAPEHCQDSQEQEHGYYSHPQAYTDFQQEDQFLDQWSYDHQPSQISGEAFAAIMDALRPSPKLFSKQEEEVEESNSFSHGAGSSWNYQDEVVKSNREEEENGIALVDKAWNLSQEAEVQGIGTKEEEFRGREEHEQGGRKDRKESAPCLFLHTEQDKLCLPLQDECGITPRAEQTSLRAEYEKGEAEPDVYLTEPELLQHVEEKETEEDDYLLYPMFRKGEELIAYFPCEGGIFLQSTLEGEGEAEENDELESLLQSAQQQGDKGEKKLEEVNDLSLLSRQEEGVSPGFTCEAGGSFLQSAFAQQHKEKEEEEKEETEQGKDELQFLQETAGNHLSAGINSALNNYGKQQQQQENEEKKKDALHELPLLQGKEEAVIEEETCADLDTLLHQVHHLLQQGSLSKEGKKKLDTLLKGVEEKASNELECEDLDILLQELKKLMQHVVTSKEGGENLQLFPYSIQLHRIKDKDVEDLTKAESDFLLHEDSSNKAGQHQAKEKKQGKQEVEKGITPDLQDKEAAELLYPQEATPRLEEEAAYPLIFKSLSPDFKLTLNPVSLVLNEFISGVRLQTQQLNLIGFYKLQPTELSGDVHKKGARGDGVPWFIKVHPP